MVMRPSARAIAICAPDNVDGAGWMEGTDCAEMFAGEQRTATAHTATVRARIDSILRRWARRSGCAVEPWSVGGMGSGVCDRSADLDMPVVDLGSSPR